MHHRFVASTLAGSTRAVRAALSHHPRIPSIAFTTPASRKRKSNLHSYFLIEPRIPYLLQTDLINSSFFVFSLSLVLHTSPSTLSSNASQAEPATAHSSSNPPMAFPCVDQLEQRTQKFLQSFDDGPEPSYSNPVSGYSLYHHDEPFLLDHGGVLPKFEIAYESWGELNADKSNVILIHTGLSASSHAKSHPANTAPGWWEKFIGPGLAIDTNRFHVICTNVIGGCYGSTGPSSIDPKDNKPYATRFPILTIFDMVRAQFAMLDSMGIKKLHASVGASMGGMQSLAAALLFGDRVGKVVSISAAARSHPYSIALRFTQRQGNNADSCFYFMICN
ncbi:Homocysteine synthase [Mortierella sp. AD010]|nr:Homocysteine synthase [Mortierella sp. AD010]